MIITTTQFNRPHYTKQFIESLSKVKGIDLCTLVISIDGQNEEVINLCNGIKFCETHISINKEPLGVNANTMKAMLTGFCLDDYVIHIEEDCLVGRELFNIAEGMLLKELAIGHRISFSHSFYNHEIVPKELFNHIKRRDTFVSVGAFGMYKSNFLEVLSANCFEYPMSYDVNINDYCNKNGYSHLYTVLSQCNNIGAEGGKHVPSPEWHRQHQFCEQWAETVGYEIGELVFDTVELVKTLRE